MIPRIMVAGLIAASERAIAAGMRAAELTADDLAPMVGKVLKLHVTDMDLSIWLVCGDDRWWLASEPHEPTDVELSGTLGSLVETARSITRPNTPLVFEGLDIRGSVGVLQTMQTMFQNLNLDWEDVITKALGPVPAGVLITSFKTARDQFLESRQNLKRQAQDFMRAEQRTLVTEDQYRETLDRIQKISRQTDRLDVRLRRLEQST